MYIYIYIYRYELIYKVPEKANDISSSTLYPLDRNMQRKRSTIYFCSQDDAQPWDSYVTGTVTTTNDQGDNAKDKRPKR